MVDLVFFLREDLLEYNIVDFIRNGEYCGTGTIKANLMTEMACAMRSSGKFSFDIKDGRERKDI